MIIFPEGQSFKFDLNMKEKKRQPTRLVNATRFASKRYCKQYCVTATFSSKPVCGYQPSLAVALFYAFLVNFTNALFSVKIKKGENCLKAPLKTFG